MTRILIKSKYSLNSCLFNEYLVQFNMGIDVIKNLKLNLIMSEF